MSFSEEIVKNQFQISEQLFYSEFVPRFNINYGANHAIKTFEYISEKILVAVSESDDCDYVDLNNIPEETKYLIGFLKFKWSNVEGKTKYTNRSFYLCFIFDESGSTKTINFGNITLTEIAFERYSIGRSVRPKPDFKMRLSNGVTINDKCSFTEYFRYINEISLGKHGKIETQKEYIFYKLYLLERDREI